MLTITDGARERLARKLADKQTDDAISLRFVRNRKRRGWLLRLDNERPSDVTVLHQGRTLLVFDQKSSHLLRNKMLDVRDTDEGPRLRLRGC
jgi:Fe-S cluster assembly iron-binding protein IscA